jgi:hypothetical protein
MIYPTLLSLVEVLEHALRLPSKLATRVRFPSPAPPCSCMGSVWLRPGSQAAHLGVAEVMRPAHMLGDHLKFLLGVAVKERLPGVTEVAPHRGDAGDAIGAAESFCTTPSSLTF